jgi:hypothetical protein
MWWHLFERRPIQNDLLSRGGGGPKNLLIFVVAFIGDTGKSDYVGFVLLV